MKPRSGRSAACVAAAFLFALPGAAGAADDPIRPANPSFEYWESDPWRPDVVPDHNAAVQAGSSVTADDAHGRSQPAARNERWYRIVLRFLLAYLTGGAR